LSSFPSFLYSRSDTRRALHSVPTRRSSDLTKASARVEAVLKLRLSLASIMPRWMALPRSSVYHAPCGLPVRPLVLSATDAPSTRSEEHTSELQSRFDLVCRLLLEKKKTSIE